MKFYLYKHTREDLDEIFYIGIGTIQNSKYKKQKYSRAFDKARRTNFWKNVVKKTTYKVEILIESDNKDYIVQKEKELIKLYGRRDLGTGTLVNLCEGGEGITGYLHKQESKDKIAKGNKGKVRSQEAIKKYKACKKGRKVSEETRKKLSYYFTNKNTKEISYRNSEYTLFFKSVSEAARYLKLSIGTISRYLKGYRKPKEGFWEYINKTK